MFTHFSAWAKSGFIETRLFSILSRACFSGKIEMQP